MILIGTGRLTTSVENAGRHVECVPLALDKGLAKETWHEQIDAVVTQEEVERVQQLPLALILRVIVTQL